MKKIRIGLAVAALLTGIVVFSAFTSHDNAASKKSQPGATTDPLFFRFIGSANTEIQLEDPSKWIFEGNVNPGNNCTGGTVVCRVELAPGDNPGIADNEDAEVAAILFTNYLISLEEEEEEYESAEDFVLNNFISMKP